MVVSLRIWTETENEETENRGNWNLEFRDCGVGTGRVDGTMPVSPIICRDCTVP